MKATTYASRSDDPIAAAMVGAIITLERALSEYLASPASGSSDRRMAPVSFPAAPHDWDKRPLTYVPTRSDGLTKQ